MRKLFVILLCCVAVLLAGYVGHRAYKVWKNKHLVRLSRDFLAKKDERNAILSLQEALHSNPNSVEAARMMAEIADASHLPSALIWRSRVVELDPHSLDDRLALAQTALSARDFNAATNALEGVDAGGKETAAYQNIAGAVAAAGNRIDEAEAYFLKASQLEPQNPTPQLNLAVVRLHGSNTLDLAEARIVLQRLAANPTNSTLCCQALRELTLDAVRQNHGTDALSLSKQLLSETNSAFSDRLLRLAVLHENHNNDFNAALAAVQRDSASDPTEISELATWEMAKISTRDAFRWLRTLPITIQTNQPTTMLITECYASQNDWRGLQTWLEKQKWTELEFVRHAFMARALRGQDLVDSSKPEWDQAVKGANDQKQHLTMLLKLAAQWKWVAEGEDILWTIVNRYPSETWASQTLTQVLYSGGQTRSLMQLFKQESERSPSNLSMRNNLAMVAMLLNAKELRPYDMAREVYESQKTNASYASTYAFALYSQGKSADALKIMRQLPPEDLVKPSVAGYYGLILQAAGDRAGATAYLNRTANARLLPEERTLFDRARS